MPNSTTDTYDVVISRKGRWKPGHRDLGGKRVEFGADVDDTQIALVA
jgi:hypothetical protein